MSASYYDLFDDIIKPKAVILPKVAPAEVSRMMKDHELNEPQAIAILGSLRTTGFALVQG